jgi:tetratricopeptide (TPR) repeat protein
MNSNRDLLAAVDAALDLPEPERDALLAARFASDRSALAEARALLAACARDDSFLSAPWASDLPALTAGAEVGGFRVLRHLASGGMGEVYEAEQQEPRRRVALKLLRAGPRSADALRRFRYEVEVLGRLRHPAIATVFGAGVHRIGAAEVPYFAMEFVEGARPISGYARDEGLDLEARLGLFAEICAGVQYGHQLGVVHRDLKPANLLVGADGRPRIIDYGIARSLAAEAGEATLTAQVVGTVGYMSPEQIDDPLRVDTRTDVYALGVVLYELLAGRAPFELGDLPLSKALRLVVEQAPAPLRQVAPMLPAEFGWIVGRAIEKEPARRYPGVAALAADLQRFAAGEAVEAGPPSRVYRFRKLVGRNKALTVASLLLVLALAVAIVGTSLGLREALAQTVVANAALADARDQAERAEAARADAELARQREQAQREVAEREARRQRAVFDTMLQTLGAVHPEEEGREVTMFRALERARGRAERAFAGEPDLRVRVRLMLAEAYLRLGEYGIAGELADAVEADLQAAAGSDGGREGLRLQLLRASLATARGDWDAAEQLVIGFRDRYGDRDPEVRLAALAQRASLAQRRGRYQESAALFREYLATAAADDPSAIGVQTELARCLSHLGRYAEAAPLAAEAVHRATAELGEAHPDTLNAIELDVNLALRLGADRAEQVARLEALLASIARVVGPQHEMAISVHRRLGPALAWVERVADGEVHLREAQRIALARFGVDHPLSTATTNDLATNLGFQKRFDEALVLLRETVRAREAAGLGEHVDQVLLLENLGSTLGRSGALADAVAVLRQQIELADRLFASPHLSRGRARVHGANALAARRDFASAEVLLREALTELVPSAGEAALLYRWRAHRLLVDVCRGTGRSEEASEHERQVAGLTRELEAARAAGRAAADAAAGREGR